MKKFRKIWDAEKNSFLKSTKGMKRYDALRAFREKWPDVDVTDVAFFNQRSRMGAADNATYKGSRKPRPLYAEQIKKDYVRIKIAQPNVWVSKAKWVYMEFHPWEDFSERSNYIFLDGNTRNFHPENIERVPLSLMGIFNCLGGSVPGSPECTRLNILRAKLKKAQLDALEKHGEIINCGNGRKDKKQACADAKRWREQNKEHLAELHKKRYYANHEETLRKQREYKAKNKEHIDEWQRQYYAKNRERILQYGKEYRARKK